MWSTLNTPGLALARLWRDRGEDRWEIRTYASKPPPTADTSGIATRDGAAIVETYPARW
jgi:hypothetical protein